MSAHTTVYWIVDNIDGRTTSIPYELTLTMFLFLSSPQ